MILFGCLHYCILCKMKGNSPSNDRRYLYMKYSYRWLYRQWIQNSIQLSKDSKLTRQKCGRPNYRSFKNVINHLYYNAFSEEYADANVTIKLTNADAMEKLSVYWAFKFKIRNGLYSLCD
jgi:hypothetical protein